MRERLSSANLGRAVARPQRDVLLVFSVVVAGVCAAAFQIHGFGDFEVFYADARRWMSGGPLYGSQPEGSGNLNLPHVAICFVTLAWFPDAQAWAVWQAVQLTLACDLIRRTLAAVPSVAVGAELGALLAIAPSTLGQVAMAQMGWVVAWLVARAYLERMLPRAAIWIGLAVSIKPFLLFVLLWWMVHGEWRRLAVALAVCGSCVVAGVSLAGLDAYTSWYTQLHYISWHALPLNWSLAGGVSRWTDNRYILGGVLLLTGIVALWHLTRLRPNDTRGWVVCLSATLLLSPLGWAYYGWILAAPVMAWILSCGRTPQLTIALCLLWVPSALAASVPFNTVGLVALIWAASRGANDSVHAIPVLQSAGARHIRRVC